MGNSRFPHYYFESLRYLSSSSALSLCLLITLLLWTHISSSCTVLSFNYSSFRRHYTALSHSISQYCDWDPSAGVWCHAFIRYLITMLFTQMSVVITSTVNLRPCFNLKVKRLFVNNLFSILEHHCSKSSVGTCGNKKVLPWAILLYIHISPIST